MGKKKLKVTAVCGMGMGTVHIIKMNVEKVLKEMEIPAEVNATNISSLSIGADTDLIVASVDFKKLLEDKPVPVVFLRNLLDKNEIREKLQKVLTELGYY